MREEDVPLLPRLEDQVGLALGLGHAQRRHVGRRDQLARREHPHQHERADDGDEEDGGEKHERDLVPVAQRVRQHGFDGVGQLGHLEVASRNMGALTGASGPRHRPAGTEPSSPIASLQSVMVTRQMQ